MALVAVAGCTNGDHAGVPKAQAQQRADDMAQTYSASVRAHGSRIEFQKLEPATEPDGELWVATYLLMPPESHHESAIVCVYVTDDDAWAHRTFEDRCVRDDGTVTGTQGS